ncbi:MAG: recombinase family protein [Bdellovibrionaceae bacterium]|nr:recombinase family protein [Pseudobdellovibrionaceae bacterium]
MNLVRGKIGDPCRSLSERIYPIDFRPQFFETRNRISSEDAKIIAEKYQKGCSLRDIAKLLGSSKNRVRSELKKLGLEPSQSNAQATHKRSLKSGKQAALPYYGFCYFEGQIVKDPREFPTLQTIHRLWSRGKSIHQINQELNRAKIPSRKGKAWSWAAIQNIVLRFKNKQIILSKGGKYEFR